MKKLARIAALAFAVAALAATSATFAQDDMGPIDFREWRKKGGELKPIAEVVKDLQRRDGFLTFYADLKKGKLLAEIPGKLLGQDMLIATSATRGREQGSQLGDGLIRFERRDNRLIIVSPNTFYTAEGGLKKVVDNTYPDPVIGAVDILAEAPNDGVVIDLKSMLVSLSGEFAGYRPSAVIEEVTKAKTFPKNAVVEIDFRNSGGSTGIYYTFNELPKGDYKPREADQRVGYFLTARKNFSKDTRADSIFERYINRWDIKKADPSLKLSPPSEPIVFYIEDSVPVKYRRYVREGIEAWNRAFEEVGIAEAIVVRQQTSSNEFSDIDPEDARYNFFRWITTETAFARGPSRVDPRTGQIFDADIVMDESMVRSYIGSYDLNVASAEALISDLSPQMKFILARNPRMAPNWDSLSKQLAMEAQSDPALAGKSPEQILSDKLTASLQEGQQYSTCTIGTDLAREFFMAQLGMSLQINAEVEKAGEAAEKEKKEDETEEQKKTRIAEEKKKKRDELFGEWPEEFIGAVIREVVMHEVGHTLGLRHNFKASSWKTWDEIQKSEDPKAATVGSIMDYTPISFMADGTKPKVWITPDIGPYDVWAIQYGYSIPGANGNPKDEGEMLKKIVAKASLKENVYATDEDVSSPDPTINRFDLGDDPLAYAKDRVKLADTLLPKILDAVVKDDESYAKARGAFRILIAQRAGAARLAAKHIGGHYFERVYKVAGETRQPITVVSAAKQKEAFKLINDMVFAPDAFTIDPELQRYMAASRWSHQGSSDWSEPLALPIQDDILAMQSGVVFALLNPEKINNLYDSEFRVKPDEDLFTLPELFEGMTQNIMSEVMKPKGGSFSTRKPAIGNLRRNLQREYLGKLITIATEGETGSYPSVARTLAWKQLKDIGGKVDDLLKSRGDDLDPYTSAHLEEASVRIQKALNADYTIGGNGGGGGFFLSFGQPAPAAPAPVSTSEQQSPYLKIH